MVQAPHDKPRVLRPVPKAETRRPAAAPQPGAPLAVTVAEAAAYLRIGRKKCYEEIEAGRIPALRFGAKIVVPYQAIEDLIAAACGEHADTRESDTWRSSIKPGRTKTGP